MKPTGTSLSEKEKLANLKGLQKIRYIWDYYKLPIAIICIVLYIIGYSLHGRFTHNDTMLYTALVNVSAGTSLTEQLSTGFMDSLKTDNSHTDFQLYTGLYLTNDESNPYYEYTYASRMKILASLDGEQLDVVLMNKEAFDAFSQNGYLCNLEDLLCNSDTDLYEEVKYPAASYGASILQRSRAAGYLTLAAVAKYPCKHGYLARCSRESNSSNVGDWTVRRNQT